MAVREAYIPYGHCELMLHHETVELGFEVESKM